MTQKVTYDITQISITRGRRVLQSRKFWLHLAELRFNGLIIFRSLNYFRAHPICCVGMMLVQCLSPFGLVGPRVEFLMTTLLTQYSDSDEVA